MSTGFEPPHSEVQFLRRRLKEEQGNAERANRARLEADARCHLAEKERDIYKHLALRWKNRRSQRGNEEEDIEEIEEAATAMLLGGRTSLSFLGIGNIFRRFQNQGVAFESSDEEEYEEEADSDDGDRMEEDEETLEGDSPSASMGSNAMRDVVARSSQDRAGFQISRDIVGRQVRTVSITGEDI